MDRSLVREALRSALQQRGYEVGGDTAGLRGELYVRSAGDLAAALFELSSTAQEAFTTMYGGQGRWLSHLPPRFAVLPVSEKGDPAVDLLTQSGLSVLFYDAQGDGVVFPCIEEAAASFKMGGHKPD